MKTEYINKARECAQEAERHLNEAKATVPTTTEAGALRVRKHYKLAGIKALQANTYARLAELS